MPLYDQRSSIAPAENHVDPGQHETELSLPDFPDPLVEDLAIDGNDLRDVRDRILRQPGCSLRQKDVSGGFGPFQIRGQGDADNGADLAPVEGVPLNHQNRPAETGRGSDRLTEIDPPDLALDDYFSLRRRVLSAALRTNASGWVSISSASTLRARVTRSGS